MRKFRKLNRGILIGMIGTLTMCSVNSITEKDVNNSDHIEAMIHAGDYTAAATAIQAMLKNASPAERKTWLFELERLDRIRKDFPGTRDKVINYIKNYYPQVTAEDMARWEQDKSLEFKIIDGEKRYFEWAGRNLFRIDSQMKQVWKEHHPDAEISSGSGAKIVLDDHNQSVIESALASQKTYVEPRRLRIKQSVEVKAGIVPGGEMIKCWIPYPRLIPGRQEAIKFIQSQPANHQLAPDSELMRTIYFESASVNGESTKFTVEYELTTHGVFHNIKADSVLPYKLSKELDAYLGETPPHIVFTPELQELAGRIVGDEQNPYRKAQLLFAWVDNNTPWASAREYSTIKCIPQYAYENHHGDCGIQTLFFMTLCRISGIPTRWQSGWELQPPDDSMHDWGMIYFEPYGWVPMDVTYGLRDSDDPRLHWFYLGGMDSYRIIFNDDYGKSFTPQKAHFRSEIVDSQRGEVEWSGGNLYFDQWSWDFQWEVIE